MCLEDIQVFQKHLGNIGQMSVLSELGAFLSGGVCMAGDVFKDAYAFALTLAKTWLICSLNILGTQTLTYTGPYLWWSRCSPEVQGIEVSVSPQIEQIRNLNFLGEYSDQQVADYSKDFPLPLVSLHQEIVLLNWSDAGRKLLLWCYWWQGTIFVWR